jgi:sensor domain CHASE-containing protein
MATEIEKELYINLKKAESFISTYGAWDDYLQYLMKDQELYAKAEGGV